MCQPGVDVSHPLGRSCLELGIQPVPLHVGGQNRVQQRDRRGGMLLIHRRNSGGFRQTYFAAVGRELPQDQFEQGGFPHPVASDQPDLGSDRKGNSRGIKEATAPAVEHEIVDLKHVGEHQKAGQLVRKGRRGRSLPQCNTNSVNPFQQILGIMLQRSRS